jgi:23S rRNA pseudouridine1911/1915/1917 synthase
MQDDLQQLTTVIPDDCAGMRVDQVLAQLFSDYSRSRLKEWILLEQVLLDEKPCKPKDRVAGGELIRLNVTLEPETNWVAEEIKLPLVFEDEHLIVINKPAGLVVHPGAGNQHGTLLNALLAHDASLATLPRAGIVHRLDKSTTGLMVVARSLKAHKDLVEQLQERTVSREYQAVVIGDIISGGEVDAPIGRHPVNRKRMAVTNGGREALTSYRVVARYGQHTHLNLKLSTGRTHQIRVHMAHIQHPIVGDPVYGGRLRLPRNAGEELQQALSGFKRQALHAWRLALQHPATGEDMQWEAPLPDDIRHLLGCLERQAKLQPEAKFRP